MKEQKNILIAFILNFAFSIFEFFGGVFTGSVALISDAVHDVGDAISIGVAYFLEKKSNRPPDNDYTYGYARFSVLGGAITTFVLIIGSIIVIYNAILRIVNPIEIHANGMILFAAIGAVVNFLAAYFTKDGNSLNQRAVNLHMLEDVLGWIIVLIGAIVIRFTNFVLLDPILSIALALYILFHAGKNVKELLRLFLVKTPIGINVNELKRHLLAIDGVLDVHHIHVWTLDGQTLYATLHVVFNGNGTLVKQAVKAELNEHGISHTTLELETADETCLERDCLVKLRPSHTCHHHHY